MRFLAFAVIAVETQMQQEFGCRRSDRPPPLTSPKGQQDTGGRHRVQQNGQEAGVTGAPSSWMTLEAGPTIIYFKINLQIALK